MSEVVPQSVRYWWLHRARCDACDAIIWVDFPARVVCVCSRSGIEPDGTYTGQASETDDAEMSAFILEDRFDPLFDLGRVTLEHLEGFCEKAYPWNVTRDLVEYVRARRGTVSERAEKIVEDYEKARAERWAEEMGRGRGNRNG